MKRAGNIQRISDESLPKRALQAEKSGRRRCGSAGLKWEDCLKRDLGRINTNNDDWVAFVGQIVQDLRLWIAISNMLFVIFNNRTIRAIFVVLLKVTNNVFDIAIHPAIQQRQ